ncbi:putative aurora kinase A [Rosellinia necatrix]|uniref:Putative aurora kinase A n=1 Tax=Rosellinia necatrix TaxID=77044 RepID=A0A1S7UKR1_ROSNE|nr:putative aurora kinase A [Rosellinia necatrix]
MSRIGATSFKNGAMSQLLSTLYPETFWRPLQNVSLKLQWGRSSLPKALKGQLLWLHRDASHNTMSFDSSTTRHGSYASVPTSVNASPPNNLPMMAYVCRDNLGRRKSAGHLKPDSTPDGGINHPVERLRALRIKSLQPKNADEDPYFVALLLAMAQYSVQGETKDHTARIMSDIKVRLIVAAEEEMAFLVYTATVPAALITMFRQPNSAPVGNPEMKIEYVRVPVWPILGLKERLGKALGSDLVGDFETAPMDTYGDGEMTPAPERTSRKRRRDVLSEVLNASFSENREGDHFGPLLRKRRRVSQGRIGVVQ